MGTPTDFSATVAENAARRSTRPAALRWPGCDTRASGCAWWSRCSPQAPSGRRRARKRGGSATKRGISREQICVVVARDRSGRTLDFVTGTGPVSKAQLQQHLAPVLENDTLLLCSSCGHQPRVRESGNGLPRQRRHPRTERQCVPQPPAPVDRSISRRSDPLSTQLSWLATRARLPPSGNTAGHAPRRHRCVSTGNGDRAKEKATRRSGFFR